MDIDGIEIKFKCEHCGQEYSRNTLGAAIFLYGIFFLLGKESGYAGINCPSCLKTIIQEQQIGEIKNIRENFSGLKSIDHAQLYLDLRYHSSVNYLSDYIKKFKDINIYTWNTRLPDNDIDSLHYQINSYKEIENFNEDLFCTYAFDDNQPMGSLLSIGWFKRDWIKEFIHIENENSVRIFPRYLPYSSSYEEIEKFCWVNHIYLDHLRHSKQECEATLTKLSEIAEQNNTSLREIVNANPGIVTPNQIDHEKSQYIARLKEQEFRKPYDFLSIMVSKISLFNTTVISYNPVYIPFIWNTTNPFLNYSNTTSSTNFDLHKLKGNPEGPTHEEMAEIVINNFYKESTQRFLPNLFNRFIYEYIDLAGKAGFCYASVWGLKEKYLKHVYDSVISSGKPIFNKVPESEREEVEAAQKQFPNVKIISDDSKINSIKIKLPKLSKHFNIDILLMGESGTGKELFARAIHESSERSGNFVPVNCASIPKDLFESEFFGHEKGAFTDAKNKRMGFFEQADGGTIFLDEIGELDFDHQGRFLRVLENREIKPVGSEKLKKVDVKIVYATNRDLTKMVADGKFRLDLYQRINEFPLLIPPLRDRNQDIPLLINHFIKEYSDKFEITPKQRLQGIADACLDILVNFKWKGNVRELRNIIKSIVVDRTISENSQPIEISDLPENFFQHVDSEIIDSKPKKGRKKKPSDEVLIQLKNEDWTQEEVANKFGVVRETVNRWYGDIKKRQSQQNKLLKN